MHQKSLMPQNISIYLNLIFFTKGTKVILFIYLFNYWVVKSNICFFLERKCVRIGKIIGWFVSVDQQRCWLWARYDNLLIYFIHEFIIIFFSFSFLFQIELKIDLIDCIYFTVNGCFKYNIVSSIFYRKIIGHD